MKELVVALLFFAGILGSVGGNAQTVENQDSDDYYTVQSGDSLSKIAERYPATLQQIADWNQLEAPYLVKLGQRLRVTPPESNVGEQLGESAAETEAKSEASAEASSQSASADATPDPQGRETSNPATGDASAPPAGEKSADPVPPSPDEEQPAPENAPESIEKPSTPQPLPIKTPQPEPEASPSGNGEDLSYYPPDIREIKERGKLIVLQYQGTRGGFFMYDDEMNFPDFPSYDDGKGRVIGYDIETAYKIADRLGVELELRRTAPNFTQACKMVARGEGDIVLSKLVNTLDRAQYVNFATPYVVVRLGVLINRLEETRLGAEENPVKLCNRPDAKVAIQTGTAFIPFAKEYFPEAQLVEYPDLDATIKAVEKGEALAMLNDEWNIGSALRMNPEIGVRVRLAFIPEVKIGLGPAISPEKPNLLNFVNLMMERDQISTTSTFLLDRYFAKGTAAQVSSSMALLAESSTTSSVDNLALVMIIVIGGGLLGVWFLMAFRLKPAKVEEKQ